MRPRNQNSHDTSSTVTAAVMTCVVLTASPSASPVAALNWRALMRKRVPSVNTWSSGPMMKRISPLSTNITPTEATRKITDGARRRR